MPTPRDPDDVDVGAELTDEDFRGQARDVAPGLLGTLLVVDGPEGLVGGLVVETEAYVNGVDPAAHLAAGHTPRTAPFFEGAGTIYVYTIHAHDALNVVTVADGYPEGVLVRAVEPTHGRDVMRERRGFDDPAALTSGPGKLTEALGVTRAEFDGRPLADARLSFRETDVTRRVEVSGRIGVSAAADWPLRFTLAGNPFVSRPVPADASLDHEAVDACYERLGPACDDAHALDPDG